MGMTKYDRLLYILNVLRSRRQLNAARLAEECGVTERSIYRDIIALSEANVPIYYDHGYKLTSDNFLPPLNFTLEEYQAVQLAIDSSPLQKAGKHAESLRRVRAKIEAGLSEVVRQKKRLALSPTVITIDMAQMESRAEGYYGVIEQAASESRCLEIEYDSITTGESRRVVEPYFIVFRGRAFYFVAFCRLRKDFRTFRIDRVHAVRLLEERFVPRAGVDARSYFAGSWQVYSGELIDVVVRLTGTAARVVSSSRHHPQEQIELQPDGSVLYRVSVRGLEEIERWLLGFGPLAIVLAPAELRSRMARAARELSACYNAKGKKR